MVPYVRMKDSKGEVDLSTSLPGQRRRDEELPVLGMVPSVPQGWDKTEKTVSPWRGDGAPSSAFFRIRGAEIVPESVTLPRSALAETTSRIGMHKRLRKNNRTELFTVESSGETD